MSKRYPLSRATRELNGLLEATGFTEEGIADAYCDPSDLVFSPDPARRELIMRSVMALESCGEATGAEFAWMSRWAACKQVYRIDPEVAASLKSQPLDGSLPADALTRLPYPVVYVDAPVDTVMSSEASMSYWPASGFVAYVDRDVVAGLPQLNLVYLHPEAGFMGLRRNVLQLNLGLPTMEEVVGEVLEYDEGFYGKSGGPTGRTVSPHIRRGHWQSFWTGPRKGRTDGRHGDRLVVKWVPPVEVNGTAPGKETVHFGKDS